MRRIAHGLVIALVTAASVLVAGPAQAAPAPSHWEVSAVSDLDPPVAGDTVELFAYLVSDTAPISGKHATLMTRTVGSGDPFRAVSGATTDADGRASTSVRLLRNTDYRWRFDGDADYSPSSTSTLIQDVGSKVVAYGSDLTLSRGQVLEVFGRAYPNQAGQRVRLWMGKIPRALVQQPAPKLLASGRVRSNGTFRLPHAFYSTGYKRLFIEVEGDAQNADGFSNYVVVKVG